MKILFKICLITLLSMISHVYAQINKNKDPEKIDNYQPRFGRSQPVVAVVALNEGTELTDFIIPFGVLSRSGTSNVISVSVKPGSVSMRPLTFNLQSSIDEFDKQYPEGADYIIVPAVQNSKNAELVNWVKSQGDKGGTVVSVCLGAMVVANTGLMDGHRATSYFANEKDRIKMYPKIKWEKNIRYVSDGKIVSSAGISASIPISIALVQAIGGYDKAISVANDLGVTEWSSKHNSDIFQNQDGPRFSRNEVSKESTGIPVKSGDDEIAIGLAADAFSMTGKTSVHIISDGDSPITLANGLKIIPDTSFKKTETLTRILPAVSGYKSIQVIDQTLDNISKLYGKEAAYSVGRGMEYPGFQRYKTIK